MELFLLNKKENYTNIIFKLLIKSNFNIIIFTMNQMEMERYDLMVIIRRLAFV